MGGPKLPDSVTLGHSWSTCTPLSLLLSLLFSEIKLILQWWDQIWIEHVILLDTAYEYTQRRQAAH